MCLLHAVSCSTKRRYHSQQVVWNDVMRHVLSSQITNEATNDFRHTGGCPWTSELTLCRQTGGSSPDSYCFKPSANSQASCSGYSLLTFLTVLITVTANDDVFVVCTFISERWVKSVSARSVTHPKGRQSTCCQRRFSLAPAMGRGCLPAPGAPREISAGTAGGFSS